MAENKKSFLLYADLIHTVRKMPKDKVGELLLTILEYVNDENPEITDNYIEVVFEPIKQQLKRDLQKYRNIVGRNKINGSKGGRPSKAKKPSGLIGMPEEPRKADSVNDTVTVSDTVSEKPIIPIKEKMDFKKLENNQWFETILRFLQLKITMEQLMVYWEQFQVAMTADNDLYRDKDDYRSHFRNWTKIQIEKNEKTRTNNRKDFESDITKQAIESVKTGFTDYVHPDFKPKES